MVNLTSKTIVSSITEYTAVSEIYWKRPFSVTSAIYHSERRRECESCLKKGKYSVLPCDREAETQGQQTTEQHRFARF